MDKIKQLKQKVRKHCLYCKKELTEKEISEGLKPFMKHIDLQLQMNGQIALCCNKCKEKIKKGQLKPLGSDLHD